MPRYSAVLLAAVVLLPAASHSAVPINRDLPWHHARVDARGTLLPWRCGARFPQSYWFSGGYGDYVGAFNVAMGALPQLAPRGQSHLLRSTSVVQRISYTRSEIRYHTFDPTGVELLRLSFRPTLVLAGGRASAPDVRTLPGGDVLLRIRRHGVREVRIER